MGEVKNIRRINVTVDRAFAAHNYTHMDGYDPIYVDSLSSFGDSGSALYCDGDGGVYWGDASGSGVSTISDLTIDSDKNWNGYNITHFGSSSYDVEDELDSIVTTIGDMGSVDSISGLYFTGGYDTNITFNRKNGVLYEDEYGNDHNLSFIEHDDMPDVDSFNHHHPERDSGTDVQMTPFIEYSGTLSNKAIMAMSLEPNEQMQIWRLGFQKIDGTYDDVDVEVYDVTNDEVLFGTSDNDSSIGTIPPLAITDYGVDVQVRLTTNTGVPTTLSVCYGFKLVE